MDAACLFLNGRYQTNDAKVVKGLTRSALKRPKIIAVDGGISFLKKTNLRPDHFIGDGDSSLYLRLPKKFLQNTIVHYFPTDKDKTDTELALDFCLKKNLTEVSIFGWMEDNNELDHFLGNLMLSFCSRYLRGKMKIQFLGSAKQVYPLSYNQKIIKNQKGQPLSIIPIDRKISIRLKGAKYNSQDLVLTRGQSQGLRNVITAQIAKVEITGDGLLIIG